MEYKNLSQTRKHAETVNLGCPVIGPISNLSACVHAQADGRKKPVCVRTRTGRSGIRIFGWVFFGVLTICAFTFVPANTFIQAQENPMSECTGSGGSWDNGAGCSCPSPMTPSQSVGGNTICLSPAAQASVVENERSLKDSAIKDAGTDSKPAVEEKCAWWSNPIKCGLLPTIANAGLQVVSLVLRMAGLFLNFSANFTLNLTDFTSKLNIDATWATIRDLMNIVFIFILLWVSINTILGLENNAKKLLASIIISALLINFSLFFTKVVIDASNVVALQFYTNITGGEFLTDRSTFTSAGMADQFMSRLKLPTIFDSGGTIVLDYFSVFAISVLGSIFIIVAAFVFFAAGLMLMARSAMLILLMVTSPIGFIGGFVPKLRDYTEMWQKELINQSLFAPIFFILIWVVLNITSNMTVLTESGSTAVTFAAAIAGKESTTISIVFNYLLLIAFIIAALNVAKKLSGEAGAKFSKIAPKMMGAVAGGGIGMLGRNASKLANMAANKWAAPGSAWITNTDKAAKMSWDLRNFDTKTALGGLGGLADKAISAKTGRPSTIGKTVGGAVGSAAKATVGAGRSLVNEAGAGIDFGAGYNPTEAAREKAKADKERKEDEAREKATKDEAGLRAAATPAIAKAIMDGMKDSEVASLPADLLTNPNIMENLTPGMLSQISGLTSGNKTIIANYIRGIPGVPPRAISRRGAGHPSHFYLTATPAQHLW